VKEALFSWRTVLMLVVLLVFYKAINMGDIYARWYLFARKDNRMNVEDFFNDDLWD
jgi:hypothetical protein